MNRTDLKIDLTTFFLSISSAAFIGLGVVSPQGQGDASVDMDMARQNIDLLELMFEKTRGNRTPEEDRLIERLLFETRLKYVEKQQQFTTKNQAQKPPQGV